MTFDIADLNDAEQAVFIGSYYGVQLENYALLMVAVYSGYSLESLAEFTGWGIPTIRNYLRVWEQRGAVKLGGTSKESGAVFLGAKAWLEKREADSA